MPRCDKTYVSQTMHEIANYLTITFTAKFVYLQPWNCLYSYTTTTAHMMYVSAACATLVSTKDTNHVNGFKESRFLSGGNHVYFKTRAMTLGSWSRKAFILKTLVKKRHCPFNTKQAKHNRTWKKFLKSADFFPEEIMCVSKLVLWRFEAGVGRLLFWKLCWIKTLCPFTTKQAKHNRIWNKFLKECRFLSGGNHVNF